MIGARAQSMIVSIEDMTEMSRKVVLRKGTKVTNLNMYVSRCRNMTSYWKTIPPRCVDCTKTKLLNCFMHRHSVNLREALY